MKKNRIIVFSAILISIFITIIILFTIIIFLNERHLYIDKEVDEIHVRNGNTGEVIIINDDYTIREIKNMINSFELRRDFLPLKGSTGWTVMLDLYSTEYNTFISLNILYDGIEFNNYYYGKNDKVLDLQEYLLAFFRD